MTFVRMRGVGDDVEQAISLARQQMQDLVELFSPPEEYIPLREYSQRNRDPEEDMDELPLQLFFKKLSRESQAQWELWINTLEVSPEEFFLSKEDLEKYKECLEAVRLEEQSLREKEDLRQCRLISETPKFIHNTVIPELPPEQKKEEYISSGPSSSEKLFNTVMSDYQTNIWRKPYDPFGKEYEFANTPADDPDFIPPSSFEKPYWLVKPAMRPYNLTISAAWTDKKGVSTTKIFTPSGQNKDYITQDEIRYILSEKGHTGINVEVLTPPGKIKWEPDIRLSPVASPDPCNYRKVDSHSKMGKRFLRMFRHNPWHELEETSWIYDDPDDGKEKKLAFFRSFVNENGQKNCVWIYAARNEIKYTRKRIRVIYPQLKEVYDKTIKSGAKYLVAVKVRVSDPDEIATTLIPDEDGRIVKAVKWYLLRALNAVASRLENENFVCCGNTPHDLFGCITFNFVRRDLLTHKQRYFAKLDD